MIPVYSCIRDSGFLASLKKALQTSSRTHTTPASRSFMPSSQVVLPSMIPSSEHDALGFVVNAIGHAGDVAKADDKNSLVVRLLASGYYKIV